ncbi:hypothetical protein CFHF_01365 [Caulobacter flavus]|uniref:DUF4136 domain-containing protein n=1 Tax=Caulobacter flavus TaxID=1679497 RepID=A0A2N5D4Z4_9CAUL|nr:hypothetical protein [Caulobacter flavus]AYV47153.1 hypothetical protein C1707_13275 [Caulobacter flavus]PLR21129.1 hypothetical protein CFHF_01365 [Caulobacter flavus]
MLKPLRNILHAAALAVSLSALSGCATNTFAPTTTLGAVEALNGTSIYVYSFLDIRDAEFGGRMLDELDRRIVADFGAFDVNASVMRFRSSRAGMLYAGGSYSGSVPVDAVVAGNTRAERQIGARYRLIIFPSDFRVLSAAQGYQIRWSLEEVATGRTVWTTVSNGSRTVWMSQEEDAAGRAGTITEGLMANMKQAGLLAQCRNCLPPPLSPPPSVQPSAPQAAPVRDFTKYYTRPVQ